MPGRKRKTDKEIRKPPIGCRLTDDELVRLISSAGGMPHGEWMRLAAFGRGLPRQIPEFNKQVWVEMARVGANLNQLTRHLNEGGDLADLHALREVLQEFRLYLIGGTE